MKTEAPRDALAWLRSKPSLDALREHYPDLWAEVEQELGEAVAEQNHAGLHALLNPSETAERPGKARASLKEQAMAVRAAIKQRMTALALERHSLAVVTGQKSGKVRFNLINGLIAQRLLFARGFERKPVSLFWFRLLWPLVWQKRFLMPLVERKGIYCFYSRELVARLSELIGTRRTLEVAAGDGTLSRFLQARGADQRHRRLQLAGPDPLSGIGGAHGRGDGATPARPRSGHLLLAAGPQHVRAGNLPHQERADVHRHRQPAPLRQGQLERLRSTNSIHPGTQRGVERPGAAAGTGFPGIDLPARAQRPAPVNRSRKA